MLPQHWKLYIASTAATICILVILIAAYKAYHVSPCVDPVYCLMITGKDAERLAMARTSIRNFQDQTYANKHLIIVNHGKNNVITANNRASNITEVIVNKGDKTLGELRNIAIAYVPENAIWVCWDDDDIRAPEYIDVLYSHLCKRNVGAVMIKHRIDYNANTNKAWVTTLETGFYWYMMRNDPRFRYTHHNKKEDFHIKHNLQKLPGYFYIIDNDPLLYIRTIHGNNTSPFVKQDQSEPRVGGTSDIYRETPLSDEQEMIVMHRIKSMGLKKQVD